jgi:hypothetical protein
MTKRRTWLWIVLAVVGGVVLCLIVVAGVGVYLVSQRVHASRTGAPDALQSFEAVTTSFAGRKALYELNAAREPQLAVPLASLPTAVEPSSDLWVQAWNPDDERLVRFSIPLWLLRLGDQKMRVIRDEGGGDLRELTLDVAQLRRVGPALLLDYRRQDGVRILLWTR